MNVNVPTDTLLVRKAKLDVLMEWPLDTWRNSAVE